ncbi:MAG: hypothetical protein V4663_12780 [Bacteroidota bacterium]
MKTLKNIAAAFALIIILFGGCKNPAEDVEIVINTDIFKSPMLIQFMNAKKGSEGPKDFNVEIIGPNANLVVTTTGGKVFKATSGLLNLLLDRTANPTPASPVKFTVVVNAAGFAPTFQDVVITSAKDPRIFRVLVAEYANPAANTGVILATKPTSNGTATTDLTFTTATNAGMVDKADITVPSGTVLLDGSGQPVGGSLLEARIVHYGRNTNVPGGLAPSNVIGANGQPIVGGVKFNYAGAVSIDMFAGTKEVKGFSKPITVDMEINSSMTNPTTMQPIKENETIPQWSLNNQTGQWKSEGNAIIVKNTAGKLVARLQITHLSTWNAAFEESGTCKTKITINRSAAELLPEFFDIYGPFGSSVLFMEKGEKTATFEVSVNSMAANIFIYSNSSINYINLNHRVLYSGVCDQSTTVTFTEIPDPVAVDVNVKFKCKGKDLLTGINAFITITPLGSPSDEAKVYNLVNGYGKGSIVNGVTYKILAAVDGKTYTSQFTANKTDFILPSGFDLTGTARYFSLLNQLSIEGVVTKDCN